MAKKTGITLAAEGEKEFRKAISSINSDMKVMQSELKKVTAEYADNEKSIEALSAKGEVLEKEYDAQKDKVEVLKQALESAKKAYGEDSEQVKKWQTSLNNAEADLAKTKTAIKQNNEEMEAAKDAEKNMADGLDDIEESAEKANDSTLKMSDVLKANLLSNAITAGLSALKNAFSDVVSTMKEMEEGYDIIATKTGATGEALEDLEATAKEVFGELPVEFDTASEAIGEVNTRFHSTGEELKNLSEEYIKFADINETDLSGAIDTTDKIMKQFGMDSSETSNLLGLITKAAQDTGESVDSLMSEIQSNGSSFKEMGFSIDETVNLLAECSANGVNTETAIAGLKKATKEFTDQGLSADEGLRQVIASIKNAKTDTEALNTAYEVFGTKGGAEMKNAIQEGRLSIDDLSGSMSNYKDVVDTTYESTMHSTDDITLLQNNVKLAVSELGDQLTATFGDDFVNLLDKIKEFLQYIQDHGNTVESIVLAIGTALISWKVTGMINSLITGIISLTAALGGATTATTGLTVAMSVNPWVLLIEIVVAAVAAFAVFASTNDSVKNTVLAAWNGLKSGASDLFNGIKEKITSALDFISKLKNSALEWGSDLIDNFVSGITNGVSKVGKAAKSVAKEVTDFLHFSVPEKGPLADADEYGPDFVDLFASGIEDNVGEIKTAASGMASTLSTSINPQNKKLTSNQNIYTSSMDGLQLTAYIEVGGKRVATTLTPLVVKQITKNNTSKEVFQGA